MAQKRLLLVEGPDDCHVIRAIARAHNIECNDGTRLENGGFRVTWGSAEVEIQPVGGYTELLKVAPNQVAIGDREALAVVLDADENLATRWQALKDRLDRADYPGLPARPDPAGTIISYPHLPRFGVWLMPDNYLPGMLEDFVRFLVPARDTLWPRVDAFLTSLPEGERLFPEVRRPKARIHTWLGIQEEPGKPLGQAVTAHYLDPHCPHVEPFLKWLRAALVD
jgi:hypothetical protein